MEHWVVHYKVFIFVSNRKTRYLSTQDRTFWEYILELESETTEPFEMQTWLVFYFSDTLQN
jgi:hypothetical protein